MYIPPYGGRQVPEFTISGLMTIDEQIEVSLSLLESLRKSYVYEYGKEPVQPVYGVSGYVNYTQTDEEKAISKIGRLESQVSSLIAEKSRVEKLENVWKYLIENGITAREVAEMYKGELQYVDQYIEEEDDYEDD